MRVIDVLVSTIQNEFANRCGDWTFDGRRVVNAYRKGKNKLVLELGGEDLITLRFKPNGEKRDCPVCKKAKGGGPSWWRNVSKHGTLYACHDCVVDKCGHECDSAASGPEQDVDRH